MSRFSGKVLPISKNPLTEMVKIDKISAALRRAALKCPVFLHCICFCIHDMHLNAHIGKRLIQLLRRTGIRD